MNKEQFQADLLRLQKIIDSQNKELRMLRQHFKIDQAPVGYVTSDAILKLPNEVIKHLGLEGGGGICFDLSAPFQIQMMTNAEYIEKMIKWET